MSNRNYGSRLAHGFYLQCQVVAGATVNKCSYLRGPAPAPGTHTGSSLTGSSLAVHPRPGSASLPKARGEAREAAQGEQELLRMAVGTSVTAPRHTHRAEKNSVSGLLAAMTQPSSRWSAKAPRLGFGIILAWDAHWVCTRKTSKSQDSLRPSGDTTSEGSGG